jgi:magnesium chelatase family protein
MRRLSGPLVDRVDLVCSVAAVPAHDLVATRRPSPASLGVRARVEAARERQRTRLAGTRAHCNGDMDGRLTREQVPVEGRLQARLMAAQAGITLSGRGHDRVLRVARTVADLDGRAEVSVDDLDEALGYRLDAWEELAA